MGPPASPPERLVFLDWVRILAFAILVLYHVGMYYVTWEFHSKSPHASPFLESWMRLSSPWRMDLLFVVSGAATSFMVLRQGASGGLLRLRARRLLIPLLFGMLVIVPPQSFLEVMQKLGYAGSYFDFMQLYLSGYKGFCFSTGRCLMLPTWNHLWFLPYLFLYTLLLWLGLRRWPALLERLGTWMGKALRGPGLLVWPTLYLAVTLLLLRKSFPQNYSVWGDWFSHSQYLAMFIVGAALARTPGTASGTCAGIWRQMAQWRWMALALALAAWLTLVQASWLAGEAQLPMGLQRAAVVRHRRGARVCAGSLEPRRPCAPLFDGGRVPGVHPAPDADSVAGTQFCAAGVEPRAGRPPVGWLDLRPQLGRV